MAYGKTSGNFNGRHINAKYSMKEGTTFLETPYFRLSEKQGDKYSDLTPQQLTDLTGKDVHPTEISGDLVAIETRENEYEGSPIRSFKVTLQDGPTRNYVEFGLGSINGRSIANALLNLTAFDGVQFSSWSSFDKAKNKSFARLSLRQGEASETVKWKYDPKVKDSPVPAAREFAGKGGKTERDYTEQEVFFFKALQDFAKVVEEAAKAPKAEKPVKAAAPASQEVDGEPPF